MIYTWKIKDKHSGQLLGSFNSKEDEDSTHVVRQWINWTGGGRRNELNTIAVRVYGLDQKEEGEL